MRQLPILTAFYSLTVAASFAQYSVPLEPGGLMTGTIEIGGVQATALFDTGATQSAVSKPLARQLKLTVIGSQNGRAADVDITVPQLTTARILLNKVTFQQPEKLALVDMEGLAAVSGHDISVVIGMDIIAQLTLSLDFDSGKAVLAERGTESKPGLPVKIPLRPARMGLYGVSLKNQHIIAMIDTGSDGGLAVNWSEWQDFVTDGVATRFRHYTKQMTAAGETNSEKAWLRNFEFDGFAALAVEMKDGDFPQEALGWNALVGTDVLQNWNWVLDFQDKTAWLGKSKYFGAPVLPDASGLGLLRRENRLILGRQPSEGSPAAEAGLLMKDVLLQVDGRQATDFSLTALRRQFCKPGGTKVTLQIERSGEQKTVLLTLKSPLDGVTGEIQSQRKKP